MKAILILLIVLSIILLFIVFFKILKLKMTINIIKNLYKAISDILLKDFYIL